jgi:hypothetical protein
LLQVISMMSYNNGVFVTVSQYHTMCRAMCHSEVHSRICPLLACLHLTCDYAILATCQEFVILKLARDCLWIGMHLASSLKCCLVHRRRENTFEELRDTLKDAIADKLLSVEEQRQHRHFSDMGLNL